MTDKFLKSTMIELYAVEIGVLAIHNVKALTREMSSQLILCVHFLLREPPRTVFQEPMLVQVIQFFVSVVTELFPLVF